MSKIFLKAIAIAGTIIFTFIGEHGSTWAMSDEDENTRLDLHLSMYHKVYDRRLEKGTLTYDSDGDWDDNEEYIFAVQNETGNCSECISYWEERAAERAEEEKRDELRAAKRYRREKKAKSTISIKKNNNLNTNKKERNFREKKGNDIFISQRKKEETDFRKRKEERSRSKERFLGEKEETTSHSLVKKEKIILHNNIDLDNEETICVSSRNFLIQGKKYKNINEVKLNKNITAVNLKYDEDDNNEKKICKLNSVLKIISQSRKLEKLIVSGKGNFDEKSIEYISKINKLRTLSFDGDDDVYCTIDCTIYSPWKTLTNLMNLNLEGTRFAEEPFAENFKNKHYINNNLVFHNFLEILPFLESLDTLNLSYNDLFPYNLTKKQFGDPKKFQAYHRWRKEKIESCATLLAKSFKGTTLYMKDNDIDEVFITKFSTEFQKIPNAGERKTVDFSCNEIPMQIAAEVILSLSEKRINFDFSNNLDDNYRYSNDNLKDYILEQVMGKVTLTDL